MNRIVISKKIVWEILFVPFSIIIINVPGSIFYNDYSEKIIVIFGVIEILITGLTCIKNNKINPLLATGMAEFVLPFLIVTIVSCISADAIHRTSNIGDITQSLIRAIQIAAVFMIAYYAVKKFGKKSLDILLIAGCISYMTIIIRVINGEFNVSTLESHGFIETIGLLFIYYSLSNSYSIRQKFIRCIVCAVILFLGGKRVAFVGIVWSLFVYFLFSRTKEKKDRIIKIIMIVYFIATFVYLYLIKHDYFSLLLAKFGVADNMRLSFWNYFRDTYQLSPLYFGRGIQFTDNRMILSSTKNALRITNNVGIHNDILRTYIGWGCIPFLYYYYNFFVLNLKKIKRKFNDANIWLYFAIVSYCFVNYMVDYMITYFPFNMCLFTIGLLINIEEKR